jgi:hypothetical protein
MLASRTGVRVQQGLPVFVAQEFTPMDENKSLASSVAP